MERTEREAILNRLIMTYEKDILRICCMLLHDMQLAEDAVQETFLKAYRGMDGFRGESSEKTWLMRIAMNTCKNMRRSAWMRFVDRRVSLDQLPEPVAPSDPAHRALTQAIMRLPRKEKEAVLLYYDQGMQVREIAGALGVSAPAISKRLKKARELIRRELEGGESDE